MSLAGRIYRELTESNDPDAYAPPWYICIGVALVYGLTLVPWKRAVRILLLTFFFWMAMIAVAD